MILSEQDKIILVMRANNETIDDIADHFKITIREVSNVFERVKEQTKSPEDVLAQHKLLDQFPYTQTKRKEIRILDGISKDVLLDYVKTRWGFTND